MPREHQSIDVNGYGLIFFIVSMTWLIYILWGPPFTWKRILAGAIISLLMLAIAAPRKVNYSIPPK